jgi:hypothetical protein
MEGSRNASSQLGWLCIIPHQYYYKVLKASKHGNRGTSVGWTCYQSLSKKNSDIVEPQLMEGALALTPLFVKIMMLIREMEAHAHLDQPFSDMLGCFQDCLKYAQQIHTSRMPSNVCISWRSCMAMITQAQPTG